MHDEQLYPAAPPRRRADAAIRLRVKCTAQAVESRGAAENAEGTDFVPKIAS
jgi:hypothetical protein